MRLKSIGGDGEPVTRKYSLRPHATMCLDQKDFINMSKETTSKQGGARIIQLHPRTTASQTNNGGMAILKSIFTTNYFTIA